VLEGYEPLPLKVKENRVSRKGHRKSCTENIMCPGSLKKRLISPISGREYH